MPDLTLWKNHQLNRMKRDIDQMFGELFRQFGGPGPVSREIHLPEIIEAAEELVVVFDLPGLDPERLEIAADETTLQVQGVGKEEEAGAGETGDERQSFSSKLHLPCRIMPEKATAIMRGTTVRVTLPKCRPGGWQKIAVSKG